MLGEALARPYVRKTFGAEGKATTQQMVRAVEDAMGANLVRVAWMDDASRKAAQEKLAAIANKIGFPERWRNYDKLEITRDSFMRNMTRGAQFETQRQLDKIGKPVDRTEFEMTPPTVNAYYDPSMNEMVFPAGILQPPFFNRAAAAPVNFGGIGMVMGHELTHGFDDEGRQFDAHGNLHEWWTPSVSKEFDQRASCVAEQFDGYTVLDGLHINGKLTLGENIADLGGVKLAHAAWLATKEQRAPAARAFTDEQLFFLGFAQSWCANKREEYTRMRVTTDPHSPAQYRVNGPLSNLSEFATAFQCKPGSKMVRAKQCVVW
jgi:endothelin-converting enzyme/putative endopeptidase